MSNTVPVIGLKLLNELSVYKVLALIHHLLESHVKQVSVLLWFSLLAGAGWGRRGDLAHGFVQYEYVFAWISFLLCFRVYSYLLTSLTHLSPRPQSAQAHTVQSYTCIQTCIHTSTHSTQPWAKVTYAVNWWPR